MQVLTKTNIKSCKKRHVPNYTITVDFARHFDLLHYETNQGTQNVYFPFIETYASILVSTNISWKLGVSYVLTPNKTIVTYLGFYVSAKNWAVDESFIPKPVIQTQTSITIKQGNKTEMVTLKDDPQIVGSNVYYSRSLSSSKQIILNRGPISATSKFSISNKASTVPMYTKNIEQNFGTYR